MLTNVCPLRSVMIVRPPPIPRLIAIPLAWIDWTLPFLKLASTLCPLRSWKTRVVVFGRTAGGGWPATATCAVVSVGAVAVGLGVVVAVGVVVGIRVFTVGILVLVAGVRVVTAAVRAVVVAVPVVTVGTVVLAGVRVFVVAVRVVVVATLVFVVGVRVFVVGMRAVVVGLAMVVGLGVIWTGLLGGGGLVFFVSDRAQTSIGIIGATRNTNHFSIMLLPVWVKLISPPE